MPSLNFLDEAEAELDEAADWYATRDEPGLEDRFMNELARVSGLVVERPRAWTELEPGIRRAVFHRFPYSLIFTETRGGLLVIAVAHHSRKPDYWRGRG